MKIQIVRGAHFSCGYTFKVPKQTPAQNRKTYGAIFTEDGYGRNFRFEASFAGKVDPESGMIVNLADIDLWLKKVVDQLDHHFLNDDVEFFKTQVPTPENITRFIFNEIAKQISPKLKITLTNVRLFENDTRWIDYRIATSS